MKKRLLKFIEERIDNKYHQMHHIERDKRMYQSNARYGSYKSVSEEALKRANRGIRMLEKDIERLERWIDWLERFGL
ncbi:MAG: hypothetical protein ACFNWZ_04670 [Candidatus Absconditicoccaceae bacterium]